MLRMPAATASSMTYWISGLSTRGSISFGWALVAGRNRVPSPAAGKTALVMRMFLFVLFLLNHRADAEPACSIEEMDGDEKIVVQPFAKRLISGNVGIAFIRPVDE